MCNRLAWLPLVVISLATLGSPLAPRLAEAAVPLEGFIPFVGMALTSEFEPSTGPNASPTFFIAKKRNSPGGYFLGPGTSAYFDIGLLDTGAATHILTRAATIGFDIDGEQFDGTNYQTVGGATGLIDLRINDPHGVYVTGLANRTGAGSQLTLQTNTLRGQISFADLSAPSQWKLPNIIGLPMAAQHQIRIRNSQPQIFTLNNRTVRTPNVELFDLGSTGHGITRRAAMRLEPGSSFIVGPLYVQNLDLQTLVFHENPLSPSVVENGALIIETDVMDGNFSITDKKFLFDTGASLTVVSEQTAVRLGFDPVLDTPEFTVAVEGSGGVAGGIPGFFVDQLRLDTVGGSFVANNVPIAVLDVTDPTNPGNVIDGILGMNLFVGRDLVIDANPSIGQGGVGPSLYIGNSVMQGRTWASTAVSASWVTPSSWTAPGVPSVMWDATVANVRGSHQEALLSTSSTVFRTTIRGTPNTAEMTLRVTSAGQLTTYADLLIQPGGRVLLEGGKLDSQFVQLDGGRLEGSGTIFVGSGPITGVVHNVAGTIAPGSSGGNPIGVLNITGDLSNDDLATLAFDLSGTNPGVNYDQILVSRTAFLSGELRVSLAGFTPQVGDIFTLISAGEGVRGTFDTLSLPGGFSWNVSYQTNVVRLQVTGLSLTGDFNNDGLLNCLDINLLTQATATGTGTGFDLNGDGQINLADIEYWVVTLKGSAMGDANLDGQVNQADFAVWNTHKFTNNTAYCSGNFNGDTVVDGRDFGFWNRNKAASVQVPEPICSLGSLLGLAYFLGGVKRRSLG